MKWQYLTAYCSVKVEGVWGRNVYRVLDIDEQKYELSQGLERLGEQEWELIAVHPVNESLGGQMGGIRDLTLLYIFKRPLGLQTS